MRPSCAVAVARLVVKATLAGALLLACADDTTTSPGGRVTSVILRAPTDTVVYGQTLQLWAVATGDSAHVARPRFTWTSSDTAVAVVDSLGVVLGTGVGTARVVAQLGTRRDSFTVRGVVPRADNGVSFVAGSGGDGGQCAVNTVGAVYCRRLDNAREATVYAPLPMGDIPAVTSVHAGTFSVCALATDQAVYCWGRNNNWIFGSALPASTDTAPVKVKTDVRFHTMTYGGHAQICAPSTADSVVYCWGHGHSDVLGRDAPDNDSTVAPVFGNLKAIAVGTSNTGSCALTLDGSAFCWGSNRAGLAPTADPAWMP